jgi:hypothetical protein
MCPLLALARLYNPDVDCRDLNCFLIRKCEEDKEQWQE